MTALTFFELNFFDEPFDFNEKKCKDDDEPVSLVVLLEPLLDLLPLIEPFNFDEALFATSGETGSDDGFSDPLDLAAGDALAGNCDMDETVEEKDELDEDLLSFDSSAEEMERGDLTGVVTGDGLALVGVDEDDRQMLRTLKENMIIGLE